jgi:hypothetical protein
MSKSPRSVSSESSSSHSSKSSMPLQRAVSRENSPLGVASKPTRSDYGNSYKAKYLKLKKEFNLDSFHNQGGNLGVPEIRAEFAKTNSLLAEVSAANLLGINCFNEIRNSTLDYNEVGPLSFTEIDGLNADNTTPDTIRALVSLSYNLMDRLAMVSEAYKEIVYRPTYDPEVIADLLTEASRTSILSRVLKSKGDTKIEEQARANPNNISGLSVKDKVIHFEQLSPIDGQTQWGITTEPKPPAERIIYDPIDDTDIIERVEKFKQRAKEERTGLSEIAESTKTTSSGKRRKLVGRRPWEPDYRNRSSQMMKRVFRGYDDTQTVISKYEATKVEKGESSKKGQGSRIPKGKQRQPKESSESID